MSKLTQIRQALESNSQVVISNVDEKNYLPERTGPGIEDYCHKFVYSVVLKSSNYRIEELQNFMDGLVPGLEPDYRLKFARAGRKGGNIFRIGELSFIEKIGEQRTTTKKVLTLTDEELLNFNGFVDGKQIIEDDVTHSYERRIIIRVYPNEQIREYILSHIHQRGPYIIPLKHFRKMVRKS